MGKSPSPPITLNDEPSAQGASGVLSYTCARACVRAEFTHQSQKATPLSGHSRTAFHHGGMCVLVFVAASISIDKSKYLSSLYSNFDLTTNPDKTIARFWCFVYLHHNQNVH